MINLAGRGRGARGLPGRASARAAPARSSSRRFIPGKDYRILVVNNQVVAVAERVPAHVVGDGTHTVAELIEITNADPRRGVGHEKILTRITVDAQTIEVLAQAGARPWTTCRRRAASSSSS